MTKRQISDVGPIEQHPKTGSSTGQYEDQFKARLPHSRDEDEWPWISEGGVHQRDQSSSPGGMPRTSTGRLKTMLWTPLCSFGSPSLIRRHSTGFESLVDVLSVPSVRNGCVFAEAHMFRERIIRAIKNRAWPTRQSSISNHVTRRCRRSGTGAALFPRDLILEVCLGSCR